MNLGLASLVARENLNKNNTSLKNSLEKLSTGLKINKASDDASGLAISDKLRTQASGIKQGIDNANSAISLTQIADKSMGEISNILDIVKSKLIQAHTDTTSEDGRIAIKKDIEKLLTQIENIAEQTNYNGIQLLSHNGLEFQVGDKSSDIIPLKKINLNLDTLSGVGDSDIDYSKIDIADLEEYFNKFTRVATQGGETLFDKSDMVSNLWNQPTITKNINDIIENQFQFSIYGKVSVEMEVNSSNFKFNASPLPSHESIYSKFNLNISDPLKNYAFIIPEDENTLAYFKAFFSIHTNSLHSNTYPPQSNSYSYIKDGANGDLGYGYFIMSPAQYTPARDEDFANNEILRKNQVLKFSTSNLQFDWLQNTKINSVASLEPNSSIDGSMSWFANPEDIQPNSPTTACGTLNDLKNMSHSAFTFDCAGGFQPVVDLSISILNKYRSEVGSTQNQLESSVRNNMTSYVNLKNAESVIRDVDYAQESANFNKLNIIAQAGSYVLSQANNTEQNYISQLLK